MSGYRREMLPTGVPQDERFSGKCGPHIQGRGAANQSHVCTGNAGSGGEFVEGEDGVLAKIDGRGVFKLNLGAAFAGDETESRLNWNAGCGLSPVAASGALTLFAARDANVAFDETEAHDLVVGWRRSGAGRRLRVWSGFVSAGEAWAVNGTVRRRSAKQRQEEMLMEALHWNSVAVGLRSCFGRAIRICFRSMTQRPNSKRHAVSYRLFNLTLSVRIPTYLRFHKNC